MSSTLKPCPFCGSENLYSGQVSFAAYGVECKECGSKGPSYGLPDKSDKTIGDLMAELQNKAIKSWNSRK